MNGTFKSLLNNSSGDISVHSDWLLPCFTCLIIFSNKTIPCKAKMHISSSPSTKQYEMMFVQEDFSPSNTFFSMDISKTLLLDSCHQEKGLILSGHYVLLRPYDIGTVRIHVCNSFLSGLLSPDENNNLIDIRRITPSTPPKIRFCYGCGLQGHLHKDCPKDVLFCYNCNGSGHSSKNCKKPKPWENGMKFQNSSLSNITPCTTPVDQLVRRTNSCLWVNLSDSLNSKSEVKQKFRSNNVRNITKNNNTIIDEGFDVDGYVREINSYVDEY
jgi:hypothetical protein